jgi:uncharacterized repeat protein (TIGR01451 family)
MSALMSVRIPRLSAWAALAALARTSSAAVAATPAAPVNTVAPSISGTPKVGLSLFADPGTWTSSPAATFTYQWRRCDALGDNCGDIAGAVASFYNAKAADAGSTIRVVVTASNGTEDASATSNAFGPVTQSPAMSVQPSISGNAVAGETLTASPGTWTGYPAPTYAYQWRLCDASLGTCSNIIGATGSTYVVASGDIGSTIRVSVTASNSAGSSSASSNQTAVVTGAPPMNTALPSISGTTTVGQTLTGAAGTWSGSPAPALAYQWQRCDAAGANCAAIGGAVASTYTLAPGDEARTIRVEVTATNSVGNASATSANTALILPMPVAPRETAAPSVSGISRSGGVLSVAPGQWFGVPTPVIVFQWQRCNGVGTSCVDIPGETHGTYTIQTADIGSMIRVAVTAMNSVGSSTDNAGPVGPVFASTISATQSTILTVPRDSATGAASADSVPADGTRFSRVRVELRDGGGNLVPGRAASIHVTIDGDASASAVRETATPGIYEVEIRTTKPNVVTVSIAVDGITLQDRAKIVFVKAVADLDITLSASNETPKIGDVVVFTVQVKNLGPNAATGVDIEHQLSDRVAYVSSEATRGQYDAAAGLWTIGGLALGESVVLKVTVKVTK